MTGRAASRKSVVVAGDVVVDHFIYKGTRDKPHAEGKQSTVIAEKPGGARLLFEILETLSGASTTAADAPAQPAFAVEFGMANDPAPSAVDSYGILTPCPAGAGQKNTVWRVTGLLGYGDSAEPQTERAIASSRTTTPADVVVLDDGALGFRHDTHESAWPEELLGNKSKAVEWVVLKTSAPVAQGDLWRMVCRDFCDRLVVVVSAADLRKEGVGITKGLSWERTTQDLLQELHLNRSISDLLRCRHLVIGLGTDGALWVSNEKKAPQYHLIFDPGSLEGDWAARIEGEVWGGMSCLAAAIVSELASASRNPDIDDAIMRGLSSMRRLLLVGHSGVGHRDQSSDSTEAPGFPFGELVADLCKPSSRYKVTKVPAAMAGVDAPDDWTIISGERRGGSVRPLYGVARRVALFGPRALVDEVPYAAFGKLLAVDRVEIESLRGLRRLIEGYQGIARPPRPLSIAVFGAPGSGKSFGVKQIAKTVFGDRVPVLEFNLSQFSDPADLIGAFHQVRDEVLKGTTPVVFWDEFDSREYMWLQYLLAPMQDGAFQEGQITHPIGKCVFVFAGGTSYDFANFSPREEPDTETAATGDDGRATDAAGLTKVEKFKLLKGPDFVSRLNGYLNVTGPNRRQQFDARKKRWVDDDNPPDLCFPVRRALLMRGILGLGPHEDLDIDSGILTALLEIGEYAHGARSLEAILTLAKSAGLAGLRRSSLPPQDQLSLHVDYDEFTDLVDRDRPFMMNSDALAPVVHEFYRELAKKEGWTPPYDVDWEQLPENAKADNVAAAARIPQILAYVGLAVVRDDHPSTMPLDEVRKAIASEIELLAEHEHDGWMERKYSDGWSHGLVRDDEQKKHPALVQYRDLSEDDKKKDRESVSHYPDIVAAAHYKIVPAGCKIERGA